MNVKINPSTIKLCSWLDSHMGPRPPHYRSFGITFS